MGTNRRRLDMLEKRVRDGVTEAAGRDARRIVAIWNGRRAKGWFHLRIGAAITAGHPWLSFCCPACQQIGEIDLRPLDRHPNATIESLVPGALLPAVSAKSAVCETVRPQQTVELSMTPDEQQRHWGEEFEKVGYTAVQKEKRIFPEPKRQFAFKWMRERARAKVPSAP